MDYSKNDLLLFAHAAQLTQLNRRNLRTPTMLTQLNRRNFRTPTMLTQLNGRDFRTPTMLTQLNGRDFRTPTMLTQLNRRDFRTPTEVTFPIIWRLRPGGASRLLERPRRISFGALESPHTGVIMIEIQTESLIRRVARICIRCPVSSMRTIVLTLSPAIAVPCQCR